MKRPLIALVILFLASITLPHLFNATNETDRHKHRKPVTISGRTMGTFYNVSVIPFNNKTLKRDQLQQQIDARLQEINQRMSTYIANSELSRINQAQAHKWVEISEETAAVIGTAQQISTITDGAFDITVGNIVNLWGFGPDINLYAIPDDARIQSTLALSGYQKLEVQFDPPRAKKHNDSLYLDLSGIAKGYGVDQIAELLIKLGYQNHLVEIGGEIRTGGEKGPGDPWSIGIERPQSKGRSVQTIIRPSTTISMATSGDYRNYFELQGKRYSHTIDPTTGYPITHKLVAVSVLHDSCMLADAYATAFMVMGPEQTMDFAKQHKLAVYMLVKSDQEFLPLSTPEFQNLISSAHKK